MRKRITKCETKKQLLTTERLDHWTSNLIMPYRENYLMCEYKNSRKPNADSPKPSWKAIVSEINFER